MIDDKTRQFLATNLKGLLADTVEWMEARNVELRQSTRYSGATPAEAKLFATLRGGERSVSDLARAIGVSRQAVHRTAHRLQEQGVVRIVPSPDDARIKIVQITEGGHRVQEMAAKNLRQIESEMAAEMGRKNLETIRGLLVEFLEGRARSLGR